ncbi:MAG: hypothetical protein K8R88_14515 [Armatimonadetes bacterium]|nr:hypothetical protein [Armatimonadota bacterium]
MHKKRGRRVRIPDPGRLGQHALSNGDKPSSPGLVHRAYPGKETAKHQPQRGFCPAGSAVKLTNTAPAAP